MPRAEQLKSDDPTAPYRASALCARAFFYAIQTRCKRLDLTWFQREKGSAPRIARKYSQEHRHAVMTKSATQERRERSGVVVK